jgi:small-conductance mechanosensitive channel
VVFLFLCPDWDWDWAVVYTGVGLGFLGVGIAGASLAIFCWGFLFFCLSFWGWWYILTLNLLNLILGIKILLGKSENRVHIGNF